jgi:arabinogalactan oligomer/maltooligosaccharide transport system permease protein
LWLVALGLGLLLSFILNAGQAYNSLMDTGDFIVVVFRTLIFVVVRVPFSFALGFTLAIILNSTHLPGRTFFRAILFLPWGASSLAILMALVWQFFFREQGTINQVLAFFGVDGPTWLNNPIGAFTAIILVDTWFSYPFFMIAILGALQSVPSDVYEAAEIDGATYWQQLLRITLPLIRPAILPATVLTSITAFQMFGTAWAITRGGPVQGAGQPGATEFVIVYAFKQIFQSQNYGRAAAFSVILFVFLFAATLYSLRLTRITKGAYE